VASKSSETAKPLIDSDRFNVSVAPLDDAALRSWPTADVAETRGATVFQGGEFLEVWRETIGKARGAQLYSARVLNHRNELALLLPLAVEVRCGVRHLTFPDGGVSDYNSPLIFTDPADFGSGHADRIWAAIVAQLPGIDVIQLEKMPAQIAGLANPFSHLARPAQSSGWVLRLSQDPAHGGRSKHFSKENRRRRRRMEEIGGVTFEFAETDESAAKMLSAMMEQKRARYLSTRGHDGFLRPGYSTYFQTFTERHLQSGLVHLSCLKVGGKIVATHWGLSTRHRYYLTMLGVDFGGAPARYSPGQLMIEELMRMSSSAGLQLFDFGNGDAIFKRHIGASPVAMVEILQARTMVGRLYLKLKSMASTRLGRGLVDLVRAARRRSIAIRR
jgi:CelD/BcsL family acetyltransferase involved in cellulose biosynthesis